MIFISTIAISHAGRHVQVIWWTGCDFANAKKRGLWNVDLSHSHSMESEDVLRAELFCGLELLVGDRVVNPNEVPTHGRAVQWCTSSMELLKLMAHGESLLSGTIIERYLHCRLKGVTPLPMKLSYKGQVETEYRNCLSSLELLDTKYRPVRDVVGSIQYGIIEVTMHALTAFDGLLEGQQRSPYETLKKRLLRDDLDVYPIPDSVYKKKLAKYPGNVDLRILYNRLLPDIFFTVAQTRDFEQRLVDVYKFKRPKTR